MTTITSVEPEIVTPGDHITFYLEDANASGKAVTIPGGSCQVVSQSADHITVVCHELHTFGSRLSNYGEVVFTVTDGGDTDTANITVNPPSGGFWGEVEALTGINASGASIGHYRYGEWAEKEEGKNGFVDMGNGEVLPAGESVLRVWSYNGTAWGSTPTDYSFVPPLADNVIKLSLLPDPPNLGKTPPVRTNEDGWRGQR